MTGAGASRDRPRVRIGDTERERLSTTLREHYAQGRLSLEELRRRAGIVLAAEYADQAEAALAELPAIAVPGGAAARADHGAASRAVGRSARAGLFSRRGHAESARPAPGWQQTAERFRDPSSGVIMRVWLDPADGTRHYVPDDAEGSG